MVRGSVPPLLIVCAALWRPQAKFESSKIGSEHAALKLEVDSLKRQKEETAEKLKAVEVCVQAPTLFPPRLVFRFASSKLTRTQRMVLPTISLVSAHAKNTLSARVKDNSCSLADLKAY